MIEIRVQDIVGANLVFARVGDGGSNRANTRFAPTSG